MTGDVEVRRELVQAEKAARKLPAGLRAVAEDIEGRVRPPVRTGALAGSIVVRDTSEGTAVETTIRYAWPVHQGTRHQAAQPFLLPLADERRAGDAFGRELDREIGAG